MRLANFLNQHTERVLTDAVTFARKIPILQGCSNETLQDHFFEILQTISTDLGESQSRTESITKSMSHAELPSVASAATVHGKIRADSGLTSSQVVAEYRALRSSVLRLWSDAAIAGPENASDIFRFNEAVDQAIFESVLAHEVVVEESRQIFLSVLGHDLRGPLNSIALTTAAIQMSAPVALKPHVLMLERCAKRMTALLDSLLEYNRAALGVGMLVEKKGGNLAKSLGDELDILQAAYPQLNLTLEESGNTAGMFDETKVREAFTNIVNNAVRYSIDRTAPVIHVYSYENSIQFSVENAGFISRDVGGIIYEPMRRGRTDASDNTNLGLGLFITRQIARAHGGTVGFSSENGIVKFIFQIPKINVGEMK